MKETWLKSSSETTAAPITRLVHEAPVHSIIIHHLEPTGLDISIRCISCLMEPLLLLRSSTRNIAQHDVTPPSKCVVPVLSLSQHQCGGNVALHSNGPATSSLLCTGCQNVISPS